MPHHSGSLSWTFQCLKAKSCQGKGRLGPWCSAGSKFRWIRSLPPPLHNKQKLIGAVELVVLSLSSAETPLTTVNQLEKNIQDTNGISPVLHLTICHKAFSDHCVVSHLAAIAQISFHSVKSTRSFHKSQTEVFVNKIAHLRLIYHPFWEPNPEISTLAASCCSWKLWLEDFVP